MSKKNTKYKKPLKDDDIAQTLAAMLSESSEDDDEGDEFGCRDGPYPDFDINKALDKVEDCFSLEELKSVLESNSSKSSEFAPCCDTAAPETRKRSASKLHPCDQVTTRKIPRKMSSTYTNPQMRNITRLKEGGANFVAQEASSTAHILCAKYALYLYA